MAQAMLQVDAAFEVKRFLSSESATATDRGIVHTETAGTAFHHGHHGIAAGLNHLATCSVTARARHHHPILSHFETAHAHGQVTSHHHHTVHHHVATDHAAAEHGAEIV